MRKWHQNRTMGNWRKTALTVGMCGLAICISRAQDGTRASGYDRDASPAVSSAANSGRDFSRVTSKAAKTKTSSLGSGKRPERLLSADDRLAVIASALDSKTPRFAERDCSHLVHAIYERAGFSYSYATSDDLYDGAPGFQRVSQPQPADLVVWRGHAGIVIRPSRHVFFSFLTRGPGTDDYRSRYWSDRGQPRFYRYVKKDGCAGCTVARRAGQ
jgi:hypothetical protein